MEDKFMQKVAPVGSSGLKPCPFCGRSVARPVWLEFPNTDETYPVIMCDTGDGGCGASIGEGPTIEDAIKRWNRRAYHD